MKTHHDSRIKMIYYSFLRIVSIKSYSRICKNSNFSQKKIIFCKNLKNFIIFKSNWSNVTGDKFPFTVFLPKMCSKLRIQIFLFSCPCMNQKTAILDFEKFVLSLHSTGQILSSRDKHSLLFVWFCFEIVLNWKQSYQRLLWKMAFFVC